MRNNKEDRKVLDQKILYKLMAHANKFIKKYNILNRECGWGRNMSKSAKAIIQWDKVRRKLIKQCCIKGTQHVPSLADTEHSVAL